MDQITLVEAMDNRYISDAELAAFNQAMVRADITSVRRAAMWCAQLGHESVGLRYYEEIWGPSQQQLTYQGRMGNINPGDGERFKGRGPIQVTGRENYTELSRWAYAEGYVFTPDEFVRRPELLAQVEYGFLGAVWYWTTQRPLNEYSDQGDLEKATRAINGGTWGIDDRRRRYERCLQLGERLLPEGEFLMALSPEQQNEVLTGALQLHGNRFSGRYRQIVHPEHVNVDDPNNAWPFDSNADVWNEVVWDGFRLPSADLAEDAQGSLIAWTLDNNRRLRRIESKLDKLLGGK
jgi:predicted chitinase